MYKFKIVNCSKSISQTEIDNIESKIGIVFPQELKEHFLLFNGGRIEGERDSFIKKNTRPNEPTYFSLNEFFPMIYQSRNGQILLDNFYEKLVINQKIIPKRYIPIGDDVSGWPICYKIDDGSIYLLYRELFDENGDEVLVHVCNSLTDFIDGMLTREEFEDII